VELNVGNEGDADLTIARVAISGVGFRKFSDMCSGKSISPLYQLHQLAQLKNRKYILVCQEILNGILETSYLSLRE